MALKTIPLADAASVYMSAPLFVTLLSLAVNFLPAPAPGNAIVDGLFQPWSSMTGSDLALSFLAGVVFSGALLSITQAYRIAVVSTVAPFEYSYLLWVTLLGYCLFGDIPGPRTIFGAALVVLCGLYIIYREQPRQTRPPRRANRYNGGQSKGG